MKLGHEQIDVELKYLDTVSVSKIEKTAHIACFWQVKICMLDGRRYHENFDVVSDAAYRVVEIRDWRLRHLEEKIEDLLALLQTSNLDCTNEIAIIFYR